jgi:antitoxin YefM
MHTLSVSEARSNLCRFIDDTADHHAPLVVAGKRNNAVLVYQEDWNAIQETMFLLPISTMRESIREGLATPAIDCAKELDW